MSAPRGMHPLDRRELAVVVTDETHAQRASHFLALAKAEASAALTDLGALLSNSAALAEQVAAGGDAYPAGIRDEAARLVEHIQAAAKRIEAIHAAALARTGL